MGDFIINIKFIRQIDIQLEKSADEVVLTAFQNLVESCSDDSKQIVGLWGQYNLSGIKKKSICQDFENKMRWNTNKTVCFDGKKATDKNKFLCVSFNNKTGKSQNTHTLLTQFALQLHLHLAGCNRSPLKEHREQEKKK